jgi:hypothetical protein
MSQKLHVNFPLPDVRQQVEPMGFQWVSTRLRIDLGLTKILDGLGLIFSLCFLVGVGLVSRFPDEDMGWMRFEIFLPLAGLPSFHPKYMIQILNGCLLNLGRVCFTTGIENLIFKIR